MPLLGKSNAVLPPIKNPVFSLTEKNTVTVNEEPSSYQIREKPQKTKRFGRLAKVFRTSSSQSGTSDNTNSTEDNLSCEIQSESKLLRPLSNCNQTSSVIVVDSHSRKKEHLSLNSAQKQLVGDRVRSPAIAAHDEFKKDKLAAIDTSQRQSKDARESSPKSQKYHNVEELSEVMMVGRATGDYKEIQRFLITTFESLDEINNCFKMKDAPKSPPKDFIDTGINFEFLDYVYESILQLPKDIQKINLRSIINCLLKDTKRRRNEDDVRALLILLINPQFSASSTYVIFAHLLRQISILAENEQRQLMHCLRGIPLKEFQNIIKKIQQFISCRLFPSAKDELPPPEKCNWWISTAAKVLALLNASNWYMHPALVPHTFFYCSALDHLELIKEYESWQQKRWKFSFCQYPFILSLTAKRYMMQKDSEMKMIVEARESIVQHVKRREMLSMGMLFLNLKVRRSHLVSDSLNEIAIKKQDLKKKLRVTFAGEPGLDMGGLTKEWFLLLIRKIFREEYGMFTYNSKIRTWWFNSASTDTTQEFNLLGVLMGLAVYNSINLDIRLPPFCYKKLLSPAVVPFHNPNAQVGVTNLGLNDLEEINPELAHGLKELLAYDGNVEDDLCQTFQASFTSYGQVVTKDLKANGSKIPVTNENRDEYVRLYVDFLLNKSIYKQFYSFYHGFHSVCASNALILLRPEEVEMLVCGNPDFDIEALQKVTQYDGYTRTDGTIRCFWEIVLNFNMSLKKKVLLFATGSDRIPVGGMSEMQFKITRMQGANTANI